MNDNNNYTIGDGVPDPVIRQKTGVVRIVANGHPTRRPLDVDGVFVGWFDAETGFIRLWSNTTREEAEAVRAFLKRAEYSDPDRIDKAVDTHIERWC